eukprot:snap_masked-scaffold_11-processed-gene-2.14-mRNA-1 protein AED:0.49 eAED:0.53 QI:0/-1/0/1/-1/1/1/0/1457
MTVNKSTRKAFIYLTLFVLSIFTFALTDEPSFVVTPLSKDEENAFLLYSKGLIVEKEQNAQAALPFFIESIILFPRLSFAYASVARICGAINNISCAEQYFQLGVKSIEENLNGKSSMKVADLIKTLGALYNNYALLIVDNSEKDLVAIENALPYYDLSIKTGNSVEAIYNKGGALQKIGRYNEALPLFFEVIKRDPNYVGALTNIGNTYMFFNHAEKALIYHKRSAVAATGWTKVEVFNNIGQIYKEYGEIIPAIEAFKNSSLAHANYLGLQVSTLEDILGFFSCGLFNILISNRQLAEWTHEERMTNTLMEHFVAMSSNSFKEGTPRNMRCVGPYDLLLVPHIFNRLDERVNIVNLFRYIVKDYDNGSKVQLNERCFNERIHIGYASCDMNEHPMGFLTLGLLQSHNLSQFKVHVFYYGADDNKTQTEKIKTNTEKYFNIAKTGDIGAAKHIVKECIQVLFDLMAHTRGTRLALVSQKPAPIIVNYLGYPGTTGYSNRTVDYILCDRYVLPVESILKKVSEKPIYLPYLYQPNSYDLTQGTCLLISLETYRKTCIEAPNIRAALSIAHLPQNAKILANFNTFSKIDSGSLTAWFKILYTVPNSYLLLIPPKISEVNVTKKNVWTLAREYGITSDRIIFIERVSKAEHVKRVVGVDLFLDSFNYGAHSTASDVLVQGVPLITLKGTDFHNRVGFSLLTNLDCEELVAYDEADYINLAQYLISNNDYLFKIRKKIVKNINKKFVFTPKSITRYFEEQVRVLLTLREMRFQNPIVILCADAILDMEVSRRTNLKLLEINSHPTGIINDCSRVIFSDIDSLAFEQKLVWRNIFINCMKAKGISSAETKKMVESEFSTEPYANFALSAQYLQEGNVPGSVRYLTNFISHQNLLSMTDILAIIHVLVNVVELTSFPVHERETYQNLLSILMYLEAEVDTFCILVHTRSLLDCEYLSNAFATFAHKFGVNKQYNISVLLYAKAIKIKYSLTNSTAFENLAPDSITTRWLYSLGTLYQELGLHSKSLNIYFLAVRSEVAQILQDLNLTQRTLYLEYSQLIDSEKETVGIFCYEYDQGWFPKWGPNSTHGSGLGGSEEAVLYLSRELATYYNVIIFGDHLDTDIGFDSFDVLWLPWYAINLSLTRLHHFVAWRYHISLAVSPVSSKKYVWLQDLNINLDYQYRLLLEEEMLHALFVLSDFQKRQYSQFVQLFMYKTPNALTFRNDEDVVLNTKRNSSTFIYSSAPNRGLEIILNHWGKIRKESPKAVLYVYYGFTASFMRWGSRVFENFGAWMNQMKKSLDQPGIVYIGMVSHKDLEAAFRTVTFQLYPTQFPETGCVSLMKGMINGAIPITSRNPNSVLPEITSEFDLGVHNQSRPSVNIDQDPNWQQSWVRRVLQSLKLSELDIANHRRAMVEAARKTFKWSKTAIAWREIFMIAERSETQKKALENLNSSTANLYSDLTRE